MALEEESKLKCVIFLCRACERHVDRFLGVELAGIFYGVQTQWHTLILA